MNDSVAEPQAHRTWRQKLGKLYVRVMGQKGPPEFIAKGVAIGLFIGLMIPMSGQLLIAIPLAYFLKASKLAAATCTLITNPWSVLIIYPIQIYIGKILTTGEASSWADVEKLCSDFMGALGEVSLFDFSSYKVIFTLSVEEIILPFFAAGFVFGAIAAIIGYVMTLSAVKRYRAFRAEHRRRKRNKLIEHHGAHS